MKTYWYIITLIHYESQNSVIVYWTYKILYISWWLYIFHLFDFVALRSTNPDSNFSWDVEEERFVTFSVVFVISTWYSALCIFCFNQFLELIKLRLQWAVFRLPSTPSCLLLCQFFHHHHRQPWAQHPLVSDAIVTIAAHRCLSRATWLNSCRVAPHHCSMSSDHSRWGRPLLFESSIIPDTRVFIFLLSFILQIWPKRL